MGIMERQGNWHCKKMSSVTHVKVLVEKKAL